MFADSNICKLFDIVNFDFVFARLICKIDRLSYIFSNIISIHLNFITPDLCMSAIYLNLYEIQISIFWGFFKFKVCHSSSTTVTKRRYPHTAMLHRIFLVYVEITFLEVHIKIEMPEKLRSDEGYIKCSQVSVHVWKISILSV